MNELYNANSEKYIIKCMLSRPNTIVEIAQELKATDFYFPATRYLYKAIKDISMDGDITSEGIMNYLEIKNEQAYKSMVDYGGVKFVESFRDDTLPPSPSVKEQIKLLKELTYRRNAVQVGEKIKSLSLEFMDVESNKAFEDIDELDDKIKELTYGLANNLASNTQIKTIGNSVDALRAEIKSGVVKGIDIGFKYPKLNRMIKRLRNGSLVVIGAPPKVGKSTILMDIGWSVAHKLGIPVAYGDSEMSTEEQLLRICSKMSGIPEDMIADNMLDNHQQKIVDACWEEIKEVPFYHFNMNMMSLNELESKVKLLQLQHGIELFVYDYVKIQQHEVEKGRPDLVLAGKIDCLKERIAKQCDICVLTSGQMYERSDERGQANKFAETSHFFKLADCILRLDRSDMSDPMAEGSHYIELVMGRKLRIEDVGRKIYYDFMMSTHKVIEK